MTMIEASGLSKHYRIYPGPRALVRELITGRRRHRLVKALDEVSFAVAAGESFGVVGENGAGKSTLLKLMTGTAVPSAGSLLVDGRVSALLELGAGFHDDFSGRENIYFSGALAGYSRREIAAREGEIIAFSELQDSIDNPVKTYSSGMILRLGFAIATGFDPAVLVIDEALAVGDQRFQKRCTDRILEFRRRGATIVFCSHNLYLVKSLCDRAVWLERGRARELDAAARVADRFSDHMRSDRGSTTAAAAAQSRRLTSSIRTVQLRGSGGPDQTEFRPGDTLEVVIEAEFSPEFEGEPAVGVALVRNDDTLVYATTTATDRHALSPGPAGEVVCRLILADLKLLSGCYHCNVFTTDESALQAFFSAEQAVSFVVSSSDPDQGLVRLDHRWE